MSLTNEIIQGIRVDNGMTKQEFAEAIGITGRMVRMLEAGERLPGAKSLPGILRLADEDTREALLEAAYEEAGYR